MPALLEKVRAAISPPKDVDPIEALARLEGRRREIEAQTDWLLTALASIPAKEREARAAFEAACKSGDDAQQIEETLTAWLDVAPKAEFAQREFAGTKQLKIYGSTMTKFRSEFPNAKVVLLAACRVRQEEAKERHSEVLAAETARLSPEGFSADQIADTLLVRRASGRVKWLQGVEKRVLSEPIEDTWKFARDLLQ
jgi:hypothetical protein